MALTNFPAGVTSFGVPVMGSGNVPTTTGTYFFVDGASGLGSSGNDGKSPTSAMATIQQAIDKCTAGKADVVIVMPGHTETVTATSLAVNKSGVSVVGLGSGTLRPTLTFGAAAATITVSAANTSFSNFRFVANFVDVVTAFTLTTAKGTSITDSEFIDTSAILNFLSCVTTNATNNDADGLTFSRNLVNSLPATDAAVISVLGNIARLTVTDNNVDKAATNDAGHLVTLSSKVATSTRILRNTLVMNALASQSTGTLLTGSSTACSGIVGGNWVYQIDTTAGLLATTGTKMGFIENYVSGAADKSGTLFPAADDPA